MSKDVVHYKGHLGGRITPFGVIQETFELADFVDGAGADGVATFETALPEGAAVTAIGIQLVEGFTGTGAVTAALEQDAVAVGAGGLVVTVDGEVNVGQGVDGSDFDPVLSDEDGELTIVASDTADWGVVVTGATGEIIVRVQYVQLVPDADGR